LSDGATESSKSRLITSAALAAIFSKIAGRDPGPNNWQRFGRATGVGWMRNDMAAFLLAQLNFDFNRMLVIKLPTRTQPNFADAASFSAVPQGKWNCKSH
jgi:hypothetical protein